MSLCLQTLNHIPIFNDPQLCLRLKEQQSHSKLGWCYVEDQNQISAFAPHQWALSKQFNWQLIKIVASHSLKIIRYSHALYVELCDKTWWLQIGAKAIHLVRRFWDQENCFSTHKLKSYKVLLALCIHLWRSSSLLSTRSIDDSVFCIEILTTDSSRLQCFSFETEKWKIVTLGES